jgi:hypothetical protein
MMVLSVNEGRIIVMGAGSKMLLTAMIEDNVSDNNTLRNIEKAADIIKMMS